MVRFKRDTRKASKGIPIVAPELVQEELVSLLFQTFTDLWSDPILAYYVKRINWWCSIKPNIQNGVVPLLIHHF